MKTWLYTLLLILLYFSAYLLQTGTPSSLYGEVSQYPQLELFAQPLALVLLLLAVTGTLLGLAGRGRAFVLWAVPGGLAGWGIFVWGAHYQGWGQYFQIVPVAEGAGQVWTSTALGLSLLVFVGVFALFTAIWVVLGRLPQLWKRDPFYIPTIGGREPEFTFPGLDKKGAIPRVLRSRADQNYQAFDKVFSGWNYTSHLIEDCREGRRQPNFTAMEMARGGHSLRLFVFWRSLLPFRGVEKLIDKKGGLTRASEEKKELTNLQGLAGSVGQYMLSKHTLFMIFITLIASFLAVGYTPQLKRLQPPVDESADKSAKNIMSQMFGGVLQSKEVSEKYRQADIVFLYDVTCRDSSVPLYRKMISSILNTVEEKEKIDREIEGEVKFITQHRVTKPSAKGIPRRVFVFGATVKKEKLHLSQDQETKMGETKFQDKFSKLLVYRKVMSGGGFADHTTASIHTTSATFLASDLNPEKYETYLVIAGKNLYAENQRERKEGVRKVLETALAQSVVTLKEKIEGKKNILPKEGEVQTYQIVEFSKAVDNESKDATQREIYPKVVKVKIPEARLAPVVKQCAFIYVLHTSSTIHVVVKYYQVVKDGDTVQLKEAQGENDFSWSEDELNWNREKE